MSAFSEEQEVGDTCCICKKVITEAEAAKGNKKMFMENCFHFTHATCFTTYAKKTLLSKKPNGDFNDVKCGHCGAAVDEYSMRDILGSELDKIRDQQLKLQMSGAEIVECPSCNSMFEFEPAQRVDYTAKDDNGKTLSKQHAEHMSKYRVRCASCKENFCIGCKTSPYHINYTCEENHKKQ